MGSVKSTHPRVVANSKIDRSMRKVAQRFLPTRAGRERFEAASMAAFEQLMNDEGDREPRGIFGGG